jgi:short-subunit dehydrogenase
MTAQTQEPLLRRVMQAAVNGWRSTQTRRNQKSTTLAGKVVVVTGGSSGNGRAIALACANRSAKVVIAARGASRLEEVADEIRALGAEVLAVPTDVVKRDQVDALAQRTLETYGKIDVWVNNAGAAFLGKIDQGADEHEEWLINLNVRGTINGTKVATLVFRHQGFGHLINMASTASRIALPRMGFYSATKAFVEVYTQALRQELIHLEKTGVRVSSVNPPAIRTPFFDIAPNEIEGRPGGYLVAPNMEADDVGAAVADAIERYRPVILPYAGTQGLWVLYDLLPGLADRLFATMRPDQPVGAFTARVKGSARAAAPINPVVQYGSLEHATESV